MFLVLRFLRANITLFNALIIKFPPYTQKSLAVLSLWSQNLLYTFNNNLYKINLLNIIIITNEMIIFFNMKFQTLNTLFYCMRMIEL